MSDTIIAPPKVEPRRTGFAEQDAFAQVEKWLAVIREIGRDPAKGTNRS